MTEYIYIVKCDGCEDEIFNFFTDARMQCDLVMSKHPSIQQIEIERNDFGECTNHCDLGTVWSWEDVVGKDFEAEPVEQVFSKADLKEYDPDNDPEFTDEDLEEAANVSFKNKADYDEFMDLTSKIGLESGKDLDRFMKDMDADDGNLLDKLKAYSDELGDDFEIDPKERKPIPEGMTIEQLVEEMEENEDTVECTWCNDLFDKSECRYEVDLGWLCSRCEMAIKSRGETLTFKEGNYWDFLDEEVEDPETVDDLGTTYDGGYPEKDKLDELEEATDYRKRLIQCPECGVNESYDKDTGFCLECGFN